MVEPVDLTVELYGEENVAGKIQAKLNELIEAHNQLEAEYQNHYHLYELHGEKDATSEPFQFAKPIPEALKNGEVVDRNNPEPTSSSGS